MATQTRNRDTVKYNETTLHLNYPVKGGIHLYAGCIGALSGGVLVAAGTGTAADVAVGRITAECDTTGLVDGARTLNVEEGIYWYNNSASGDLIAQADVGKVCYVVDDATVGKTSSGGTRMVAGRIVNLDPTMGVAVQLKSVTHSIT